MHCVVALAAFGELCRVHLVVFVVGVSSYVMLYSCIMERELGRACQALQRCRVLCASAGSEVGWKSVCRGEVREGGLMPRHGHHSMLRAYLCTFHGNVSVVCKGKRRV